MFTALTLSIRYTSSGLMLRGGQGSSPRSLAFSTPFMDKVVLREATLGGSSQGEAVTPAAEKHARRLGLYGSVVLTKQRIHELMPSVKSVGIDLAVDPEDAGYATICFTITTADCVSRALECDDSLRDALIAHLPQDHYQHLTFKYQFV